MNQPDETAITRLANEKNIWAATVRPSGKPHLAPVWFVYHDHKIYFFTDPNSVKAHNLESNPQIALALEGGNHAVICEGLARTHTGPAPQEVVELFIQKYEWNPGEDDRYSQLYIVEPQKWLVW